MDLNKELISLNSVRNYTIEELLQTQNVISPAVDIVETNDEFTVIVNLPGLRRENLLVKVEENNLVIFGKADYDMLMNRKYILQENEIGNYHREFKISDTIERNNISAKYDNGQLMVILPKKNKNKPRTIEID